MQDRVLEAVEMVEQKGNALALEQASSPNAKRIAEGGVGYYRVQMLYLQVRMSPWEYPPLGVPSEYVQVRKLSLGRARRGLARHAAWAQAARCLARGFACTIGFGSPVVIGAAGWLSRPLALSRAPLCRGGL